MSTQIFINPNQCKPEYTKIAAHSFAFEPVLITGGPNKYNLFYGTYVNGDQPIWSNTFYDYSASVIDPGIKNSDKTIGIPLPINLVSDDIVTISGTASFNNIQLYQGYGWEEIRLVLGVYYFDCASDGEILFTYTFIPVESFLLDKYGNVCFETSVTLGSNYDIHNTRFMVGFNVIASCPSNACVIPVAPEDLVTVSYTFDIERPCAVITSESNFIIKNCCEPLITELVNIPGLQVGGFHVDDEGNCWEVISASKDVTNFTRNFVDVYTSCVECQNANPCPENLQISSCCIQGAEFVSGSLPGLLVGDTFVDNNGLCWTVQSETGAPISEESITVDTIIPGDCTDCTTANPCPSFWFVESCCARLSEVIATTVTLNPGDSFVDTNGICWSVVEEVQELPTNYNIVVDTVYTGGTSDQNCEDCTTANPCPENYFLTVRACCDADRIEVISVPAFYMSFSEGTIFSDEYDVCWEVMSYDTTGVETYTIDWEFGPPVIRYRTCFDCSNRRGREICRTLWQVRDCNTNTIYTAVSINNILTVGSYYSGLVESGGIGVTSCFEILGYGYPQNDPFEVSIDNTSPEYATCPDCNNPGTSSFLEVTLCCNNTTITVFVTTPNPLPAPGTITAVNLVNNFNPALSGTYCCTIGGPGTPQPPLWSSTFGALPLYNDCPTCINDNPCF